MILQAPFGKRKWNWNWGSELELEPPIPIVFGCLFGNGIQIPNSSPQNWISVQKFASNSLEGERIGILNAELSKNKRRLLDFNNFILYFIILSVVISILIL